MTSDTGYPRDDFKPSDASESAKKVMEEIQFVDELQLLTDYGNSHKLRSFKIRLVMEEDNPAKEGSKF
jgi:hypothetical protein